MKHYLSNETLRNNIVINFKNLNKLSSDLPNGRILREI